MKPTIKIDPEVYRKVMHWVNKSNYEVSGLGMVQVQDDGTILVTSAMLLPQKNTASHTEIDAEAVNKALYELRNETGALKWWWHSHVKMPVFWSGTDNDTIKELGGAGWIAATVFNKKNECRSACYLANGQQTPWGNHPLFLDELRTVLNVAEPEVPKEWDEEYEKNVTNQTYSGGYNYKGAVQVYNKETGRWENEYTKGGFGDSQVGKHKAASHTTPTTTGAATAATGSKKRPPNMSKRAWKRLKKPEESEQRFHVDSYGLTQEDRQILAEEGWDDRDLDTLLHRGFSISQIMYLVENGWSCAEIEDVMDMNQTLTPNKVMQEVQEGLNLYTGNANDDGPEDDGQDIDDDIPVADRRHL